MKTLIAGVARWTGTWSTKSNKRGFGNNGGNGCYTGGAPGHYNGNWTTDYEIAEYEPIPIGDNVALSFVDGSNNPIADASVNYNGGGSNVTLTSADGSYNFGSVGFFKSLFSSANGGYLLTDVVFDEVGRTMKFVFSKNPNFLRYSSAPSGTDWAPDTQWFVWRNNRNQNGQPSLRYVSTSDSFVNANHVLNNSSTANGANDRGGLWCFVGNDSGFEIYNAAYGPAFIFAYVNGGYTMVPREAIPSGATTTFTYEVAVQGQSQWLDGASHGYVFRIGTAGSNQIHSNSSGLISWNGNGSLRKDDGGSVFKITAYEDINTLPAYDVYHVSNSVSYSGPRAVFGKRNAAPYIILAQGGAEITKEQLSPNADIENVNVTTPAGTYIKEITVIKDNEFSPAPINGEWATGTKWFTIRNHRAGKYITVENGSMDTNYQLKWGTSTAEPTNAEGLWCFVEDGSNGFRIYNKAYGPDFAIQMTGTSTNNYLTMVHLSEIVSANSHFHFVPNTNTYNGNPEVCFILGANSGGVGINSISGSYPGVWAAQESNHRGDQGSAFYIHRIEDSVVNATKEYTAYKVVVQPEGLSVNVPVSYEYAPVSQVGAKTEHHTSKNFILIQKGVDPVIGNFSSDMVPAGFTNLTQTQSTTSPRYNIITLTGVVQLPHVIHRPNGNLWRAIQKDYDGTATNTIGKQTPEYTEVELDDHSTVKLQHTGVFEITHFLAPGEVRQIWMPSTSSSANGQAELRNYMRWFNYRTEGIPEPEIVNLDPSNSGIYNRAMYFKNGIVCGASITGSYPSHYINFTMPASLLESQTDYEYTLANEATRYTDYGNNFTSGTNATGGASYLGTFVDPNGTATGNKNLIEPTIGARQIYHLRSAHEMATNLSACVDDKWLEEETITFPTRGLNWNGYEDVIPLDYNFLDYWAYNNSGELRNVRHNGTTIQSVLDANGTGITLVTKNAADFLAGSTGVFAEVNTAASREAGHYMSFDYPSNGIINLEEGETSRSATYYVYLEVDGKRYNLKKFTLIFQNNVEPVPYYEILSDPTHPRSDKSLAAQFGNTENPTGVYTQLNFHYPNNYKMGAPNADLAEGRGYFAFPYNFDEVTYSYYANGMAWSSWGEYGMRNDAQTATRHNSLSANPYFLSVNYLRELYKKKVATIEKNEAEAALAAAQSDPSLNDSERDVAIAEAEYRIAEANTALAEVTTESLSEAYHDNYYIYVDASEQPGQVGRLRINEPLCTGTRIYGTAWLSCATAYTAGSPIPASVIFRFKGVKADGTMTNIYSYCPGQISNIARDRNRQEVYAHDEERYDGSSYKEALWQQVAFSFVNPYPANAFVGFVLEIFNNCRGSSGGDIFLDDIRLFVKTPQVNVDNAAPICGDELSIVRISTDFDAIMDALQGNTHIGEKTTYYGTYAILDKDVYDKHLEGIASPTQNDVAEAFNLALMGEHDKSQCYIGDQFFPELYAFHDIKFYSDYLSHEHMTYAALVGDNILDTAGYMYQYNHAGEIISRNLVFNCKLVDERIAGKKYYLVFAANLTPHDMSSMDKAEFAEFFSMGDPCCVRSEFQTMRAQMVKIEGADELDPFNIDYCPGTAPTISLNSYGYDINGELIQEHGVYYDWYFGTKEQFRHEYVWLDGSEIDIENIENYTHREILTAEDFCMEHCLMNFRYFYPNAGVNELYDGTVRVHHFEKDDDTDTEYELTAKMIGKLKEWVEAGKLRLHLTAVSVDLSAYDAMGMTHVLAIQQGAKLRYEHADVSKENPILYCIDPVEISFHTNLESPGASVGLAGVDYSATPYNRDVAGKGVYHSVPLRVNNAQIRAIRDGKELELPIRVIIPSGYYKVDEGGGLVNAQRIHLEVDDADNDIYVAETNDPQWQLRHIDGTGGEFVPSVGKLLRIDADKERTTGYDNLVIQFNDATHDNQLRFVPREGYYYLLRTQFTENLNPGVVLAPEYDVPEIKCKGNILIPLKIVPEYMKWTGRESDDWNNDRNWIRADYRELVPSDNQNPSQSYSDYATNTSSSEAYTRNNGYNGLPVSANDDVIEESEKDMYIPMDVPSVSALYNTFAYAPMAETSVIIPTGSERYPAVSEHPKTSEDLIRLTQPADGTNTPWIAYDMVAERDGEGNYNSIRYYENRIKDIIFQPATMMYDAHHLTYEKAWVEYALNTNRWYTVASPLQETVSGEWYSPTASGSEAGRQLTPHFRDINYDTALNNRFNPAYYQRSWDKGTADMYRMPYDGMYAPAQNPMNVAVSLDWSKVYNDVNVAYSSGGFSVKPAFDDGHDGEVLVRMPKADASYRYYDHAEQYYETPAELGGDETSITRGAGHYRLLSDKWNAVSGLQLSVTNANPSSNLYHLVANPMMAPMDMDEFFSENPQFEEGKFWMMSDDKQTVSVKVDDSWFSTSGAEGVGTVAPLQAFFVKLKTPSVAPVVVTYTTDMQQVMAAADAPQLRATRRVERDDQLFTITATDAADASVQSTAAAYFCDEASNGFVATEDAELLLDSNVAQDRATVFTVADAQALQFNVLSQDVQALPIGVIAPNDESVTLLTFTGTDMLATAMDDAPYLYDAANGSFTAIEEGQTFSITGTSTGRYFIVSGMQVPGCEGDEADAGDDRRYNLHGVRVASPQHGTVTIQGKRKLYNQ